MKRVPVCPVQMAEVLIIYEIFPSVLDHFFLYYFFALAVRYGVAECWKKIICHFRLAPRSDLI